MDNMIKLKIKGMTCQLCAETIKKALESVEGEYVALTKDTTMM